MRMCYLPQDAGWSCQFLLFVSPTWRDVNIFPSPPFFSPCFVGCILPRMRKAFPLWSTLISSLNVFPTFLRASLFKEAWAALSCPSLFNCDLLETPNAFIFHSGVFFSWRDMKQRNMQNSFLCLCVLGTCRILCSEAKIDGFLKCARHHLLRCQSIT